MCTAREKRRNILSISGKIDTEDMSMKKKRATFSQ